VLFTLAGLMALVAVVRLVNRFRKPATATERLVSDSAILGAANRELAAVKRGRDDGGWTPALAGRALAPLRVAAAYALGHKLGQTTIGDRELTDGSHHAQAGNLIVRTGWPKTKRIAVSGAVTPQAVARELARPESVGSRAAMLESLEQALTRFTAAQYGREAGLDDAALDESLAAGTSAVRRVRIEQLPIVKRFSRRRPATEVATRAWSR
jgi:hypothetical protein